MASAFSSSPWPSSNREFSLGVLEYQVLKSGTFLEIPTSGHTILDLDFVIKDKILSVFIGRHLLIITNSRYLHFGNCIKS